MRLLRLFSRVIFILSLAAFVLFQFKVHSNQDHEPPVINLPQDTITASVKDSDEDLLAGITAVDDQDGDVTDTLIVESLSHFVDGNTRTMKVIALDRSGNLGEATCDVVYQDYKKAHFELSGPLRFPLDTQNILYGMTVNDVLDGDISERIMLSSDSSLTRSEPGDYPMTFTVSNSAGDLTSLDATVTMYIPSVENSLPHIELSEYLVNAKHGQRINPLDYVRAITIYGQRFVRNGTVLEAAGSDRVIDLSELKIDNKVDPDTAGSYEITYSYALNEDSNVGTMRLIVVVEE